MCRTYAGSGRAHGARGEIRFERVDFAYDPAHPILRDIDFDVQPGQRVAFRRRHRRRQEHAALPGGRGFTIRRRAGLCSTGAI